MRTVFNALLSFLLVLLLLFVGGSFYLLSLPDVSVLRNQYPSYFIREGEKRQVVFGPQPPANWVSLSQLSRVAMGAVIVSEDWAFYQHSGFDLNQIKDAIQDDLEAKSFVRGASTITQQVARNLFLTQDKSLWRKLKELYLAILLEKKVGKKRILEAYFNIAEWGEKIYGIGEASHFYFHKEPALLTAKEGAFLAMLLPSPKRYSQSYKDRRLTDYAKKTVNTILEKMVQAQYLTEEEMQAEKVKPLLFEDVQAMEQKQKNEIETSFPEDNDI